MSIASHAKQEIESGFGRPSMQFCPCGLQLHHAGDHLCGEKNPHQGGGECTLRRDHVAQGIDHYAGGEIYRPAVPDPPRGWSIPNEIYLLNAIKQLTEAVKLLTAPDAALEVLRNGVPIVTGDAVLQNDKLTVRMLPSPPVPMLSRVTDLPRWLR